MAIDLPPVHTKRFTSAYILEDPDTVLRSAVDGRHDLSGLIRPIVTSRHLV